MMNNDPFHPSNHLLVGNSNSYLLLCEECYCRDSVKIVDQIFPKIPWLTTLKCTKHNNHPSWSICKLCTTQMKQFKNVQQIKRHNYKYHQVPKKKVNVDHTLREGINKSNTNLFDYDNDYLIFNNNEVNDFDDNSDEQQSSLKVEFNFSNEVCNEFFAHQYKNNKGDSYLVSNGCFDGEVQPNEIDETEKKLILLITNLSMVITRDQYSLFTSILALHEKVIKKRLNSKMHQSNQPHKTFHKRNFTKLGECEEYCKVHIPRTPEQLRSMTTNRKKSVLKSLPIPDIEKIGDHTYLSIIDIISDILAHGYSVANITIPTNDNVTSLSCSPLIRKVKENGDSLHEGFPLMNLY